MILASTLAQALAAATPEAAVAQGVIAYPPDFFAAARPATAFDMVSRLPGFTFDGGDDVRGFEGAAGNVLIDGRRPVTKTDDLEEVLRRVPASQVARIDLIRGGAPGIDMQGKSVLANVVRKNAGGFRGVLQAATNAGPDGRNAEGVRLELSGGRNDRSWEAALRYGEGFDDGAGDGPRLRLDGAGRPLIRSDVQSEGLDIIEIATGAFETPFAGGRLRLNGRLSRDLYDYDEINRTTFPGGGREISHDGDDKDETEIGGRFSRSFGARTTLELIALQQTKDRAFASTLRSDGGAFDFALDSKTGERIGRVVATYRANDALSFETGGEGAFNWLRGRTRFAQDGVPIVLPAANVRVEETRGEVFAKTVWRPSAKWTVEGGVRYEGSNISSEGDVVLEKTLYFAKPRFAVTWAPDGATQVRVRVERMVGQLDFDDFVAASSLNTGVLKAGNPDIDPEQEWVAEGALERRFWKGAAVVLTLRHKELTDVVDRAPVFLATGEAFDAPANIGSGARDEVAVTLTLPFDRLGLKGAQLQGEATWRKSRVKDPTTGVRREISGLRPLEWEAHFTHDLPQWRANWGVDVFGAWRETYYSFDQIETKKLKTYVRPFVEWKPRDDFNIRLELANATSRGFRNTRQVYGGPRSLNPLAYTEDRDIQFGRMVYVRLRKTFGG